MNDGRFLAAVGLVSTGTAYMLARYGLRRWLALPAHRAASEGSIPDRRMGALLISAGLVLSASSMIERMVWMLVAAWSLLPTVLLAARHIARNSR